MRAHPARPFFACILAAIAAHSALAAAPDWDRVANVKAAAVQIGEIQVQQGADKAFKFITDCYKTHGLAAAYSKAFEGCIAQDFMLMEALAAIYSRVDPKVLQQNGVPSVAQLVDRLNERVSGAYANYQMPPGEGQALRKIVDTYGMPVFLKIIFPKKDGDSEKKHEEFVSRMTARGYTPRQVRRLVEWYMRVKKSG